MIIESVVIGILGVLGLYFLKMEHHTRKIKLIVIALIVLLFYLSATGMFNSGNVDITSPKGIVSGIYLYVGWLGESIGEIWDIGVETTGRVVDAVRIN
jgi:hypothetical protein